MSHDESRSSEDRVDLSGLYADRVPPRALEDRVVDELTLLGLLRAGPSRPALRRILVIAAGAVLFFAGWVGGSRDAPAPAPDARYMLLLWEDGTLARSEAPDEVARAYGDWAVGVASRGIGITGHELGAERARIPATAPTDPGPDARIGGYFVVEASSEREVEALLADHPHLRRGGWIEVARIVRR